MVHFSILTLIVYSLALMVWATPANDIGSEATGNLLEITPAPSSSQVGRLYGSTSPLNGTPIRLRTPKGRVVVRGSQGFGSFGRIEIEVGRCAREVMTKERVIACQDHPKNPALPYWLHPYPPDHTYPADTFSPEDFSLTTKATSSPVVTSTVTHLNLYTGERVTMISIDSSGRQKEKSL